MQTKTLWKMSLRERQKYTFDAICNDRKIKDVLLAISKGQPVTPDEIKRAKRYEKEQREKKKR
jgi:hypothetical protein